MTELGIGHEPVDHLAGRHLDRGQVVVTVRDRVRNVVKQLGAVVPVVREGLDNL